MKQAASIQTNPDHFSGVERFWTRLLSACLGLGFVVIFNLLGPFQIKSTEASGKEVVSLDVSRILVDWTHYTTESGQVIDQRNPISIQAFMWVAMFVGFGELWLRVRSLRAEQRQLRLKLLPEDESTLLTGDDLRSIYVNSRRQARSLVLPVLIRRLTMEFRKSKSVDRVNALLDTSLELFQHQLDLRYTWIRYIVWLIPTLGFIGTVFGIADAMAFVGSGAVAMDSLLAPTTQRLAVAFYTTLVALIQSGVLVFCMNALQAGEEKAINDAGQYCLENLIIRLLEPSQLESIRKPH